ncbi:MAG TPA: cytochrome c oxidase subunit II [Thermoanaerobaculia bacterium]|nr:cytochrome c oxidase subunit II [Thermoanaerobaculia bacterium]
MTPNAPLFPTSASELARSVDTLFFFALAFSLFFAVLIAVLIALLGSKYRRRHPDEVGVAIDDHAPSSKRLELAWTSIPFGLLLILFGWGTWVFFLQMRPPDDAVEYWVTGKQWMWKMQHPDGTREINELHVPLGQAVKLKMISEDVIHDFFVPAFRVHVDVLPSRYTTYWFKADKTGTFHLFCGQYCGVEHAYMVGRIVVMDPKEYEQWLAGVRPGRGPLRTGEELFIANACNTCHRPDSSARAPILNGIFGKSVKMIDGASVVADDGYIRDSILNPQARIVAGYQPIMPTFKGVISEEELLQLVEYVKKLPPPAAGAEGAR